MIRIEVCDARRTPFPDAHFHTCVTSPPYYALRAYGSGQGEVGAEASLVDYVASLVEVGREVRRVLRDDGTWWLNLGDTYGPGKQLLLVPARVALALQADGWVIRSEVPWLKRNGMPGSQSDRPTVGHEAVYLLAKRERYYFDLDAVRRGHVGKVQRDDGREPDAGSRIAARNQQNGVNHRARCGNSSDTTRFWRTTDPAFDALDDLREYLAHVARAAHPDGGGLLASPEGDPLALLVPTSPSALDHFAMWPPRLVAEMVRASTSEAGCCSACGAPLVREVAVSGATTRGRLASQGPSAYAGAQSGNAQGLDYAGSHGANVRERRTTGWRPPCACGAPLAPCRVYDPFSGSGTTAAVADALGRDGYGAELNPAYAALSDARRDEVRAALRRANDRKPLPGGEKFQRRLRALLAKTRREQRASGK